MTSQLVQPILAGVLGLAVALSLPKLVGKPTGFAGRASLWLMNIRHSGVTDWGLGHVRIEPQFTILDVGCGGGRTIGKLAAMTSSGKVHGVDISDQGVALSRRTNERWIAAGRVDIQRAPVSQLPFPERTFDLVTAVETHYYWPDIVGDLREIRRVLKPGGRVLIIAETFRGMKLDAILQPVMKLIGARYLTIDEHRNALTAAGFSDVTVDAERGKGWICCVGFSGS